MWSKVYFHKIEKFQVHLSYKLIWARVVCISVLEESDKNYFAVGSWNAVFYDFRKHKTCGFM